MLGMRPVSGLVCVTYCVIQTISLKVDVSEESTHNHSSVWKVGDEFLLGKKEYQQLLLWRVGQIKRIIYQAWLADHGKKVVAKLDFMGTNEVK